MTRKQFKKNKRQRQIEARISDPTMEKPTEADPEKIEKAFKNWRESFLIQFDWYRAKHNLAGF